MHPSHTAVDRPAVMVTGASGLIGVPVCQRLVEEGYFVFAANYPSDNEVPLTDATRDYVKILPFDATDLEMVQRSVDDIRRATGGKLASVVHLAAYYDFSGEESEKYEQITVRGTDRLLGALKDFELEQFIFSSTLLVHPPRPIGEHITEDDPLEPSWPYPASKIETEALIRSNYPHVRSVLLRIAGVYTDYGQQPTLVQQIKRIYEKNLQSHVFPGDSQAGQSCVHLDDAVDSIIRTVQRRHELTPGLAILIGEANPTSYEELQNIIGQKLHGEQWTTMWVPKAVAKAGAAVIDTVSGGKAFIKPFMVDMADAHYAINISRAKRMLGWEPRHRLANHLEVILDNLKRDPEKWYRENGLAND
jgi:2-alkyl-3-oxoalkanoate reductase